MARMAQQCHAVRGGQLYCAQPETVRIPYFTAPAFPVLRPSRRSDGHGVSARPIVGSPASPEVSVSDQKGDVMGRVNDLSILSNRPEPLAGRVAAYRSVPSVTNPE